MLSMSVAKLMCGLMAFTWWSNMQQGRLCTFFLLSCKYFRKCAFWHKYLVLIYTVIYWIMSKSL